MTQPTQRPVQDIARARTARTDRRVDVAVIGAGSAGLTAFRAAQTHSDNVVLIEGGVHGTTCARVGCMPSKLLIAAAEAAHVARDAGAFGVETGDVRIDGAAVMDRVRRERDRFVGFVVDGVERIDPKQRLTGYARFLDDHRLAVGDDTIVHAERIVIATGSSPSWPSSFDALGDRLVVNDDVFDWTDLPGSVAVFGPGVIGLELGQALARLGVSVRVFGIGGQVGPLSDPVVMATARDALASEFYLDADARIEGMARHGDGVRIDFIDRAGKRQTTDVDYVLAATGRRPNLAGLDLGNTTLPLDERGVPVFDPDTLQIGDSHVFIAGAVNDDRPLLHEAADEGRIAGDNAGRFPSVSQGNRRSPLAVVFTDPQMALVGERFADLDAGRIAIGEVSFEDQGRSRVMRANRGLLRVYVHRRDRRFLGAEMAGPRAEHVAHLLAWAHQSRLTVDDMLAMPFYHPVVEEGVRTALRDARAGLDADRRAAA